MKYTKKQLLANMYRNQKRSSIVRGHAQPDYTLTELVEWAYVETDFHKLYDNWVKNECNTDYIPSVDRLNNDIGYTFDNIRMITWKENKFKEFAKGKGRIPIVQIDKTGKVINEFDSTYIASKALGVTENSIYNIIIGKTKTINDFFFISRENFINKEKFKEYVVKINKRTSMEEVREGVIVYNVDGVYIGEFNDLNKLLKLVGVNVNNLKKALKGDTYTCGGYIVIYKSVATKEYIKIKIKEGKKAVVRRNGRSVSVYDLNGKYEAEYMTISECMRGVKITKYDTMLSLLNGKVYKHICKIFIYNDEFSNSLLEKRIKDNIYIRSKGVVGIILNNRTGKKR